MKKNFLAALAFCLVMTVSLDTSAQLFGSKEKRAAKKAEKEAKKLNEVKDQDPDKLSKSELRLQNQHLMETIKGLEAEITELKDKVATLEDENMSLTQQNQTLLQENEELKAERENYQNDFQALAAEYESLKAENEQLKQSGGGTGLPLTEEQMATCNAMSGKMAANSSYRADGFWKIKNRGYGVQVYSFDNLCDAMAKAAEFDAYYNLWKVYITVKEVEGQKMYSVVYGCLKNKLQAETYIANFKNIARNDAEKNAFLVRHNGSQDDTDF